VTATSSPDNDFEMLTRRINEAKRSIKIAVYELDNPFITDALEKARGRGVDVTILLEGGPIPKVPEAELYNAKQLTAKGANVLFYDIEKGRSSRTFKYFHNKYTVIDGKTVVVGSANYGSTGHPESGTTGNREWEVILDDDQAALDFGALFEHDSSLEDEWVKYGSSERYTLKDSSYKPDRTIKRGKYDLDLKPVEAEDVPVATVFAPDNALDEDGPILGPLNAARESVYIEQLNFETYWGDKPYNREKQTSPLMDAVLRLAKAGRTIRILLNDDNIFRDPSPEGFGMHVPTAFSGFLDDMVSSISPRTLEASSERKSDRDNKASITYLMKIAKRDNLKLYARPLNYRKCGLGVLHNKGMIVDEEISLVSSINWGESAMKFNREAGVVMKNRELAAYYTKAFQYDWNCSASK
jgi:phosphatidylserine/phosphatidylglycerophosphate/cardiolipin synthase-like enzyme